ncbi:hypothetical protein EVAR_103498_1 [Eumeta japonica]|uniref:Uncharacterized protein n=1 Tax=Eumeta variegata TaxID=151549 RepID=A0A4C1ZKB3_EUMVA|nr:hypothetical protein EVAR_103498_1 [Eumeta japonica]
MRLLGFAESAGHCFSYAINHGRGAGPGGRRRGEGGNGARAATGRRRGRGARSRLTVIEMRPAPETKQIANILVYSEWFITESSMRTYEKAPPNSAGAKPSDIFGARRPACVNPP